MSDKSKNTQKNHIRTFLAVLAVILSVFNIIMSFYLFDLTNKNNASESIFSNIEDYRLYAIEHGMQLTQDQVDILIYDPYGEEAKALKANIAALGD